MNQKMDPMDFRNEPDPGTDEGRAAWFVDKLVPEIRRYGYTGEVSCSIILPRWLKRIQTGYNSWTLGGALNENGINLVSGGYEYEQIDNDFKILIKVEKIEIDMPKSSQAPQ